ncbi:SDR family NAD(P)-dependent oxidoreductase [Terriglobus roseus]|uniref:SDR family NAD(P)-dependent oxidoreductase n=1 Tax=Terriglobus roseus TaxID=392734 RepID=UPI00315C7D79
MSNILWGRRALVTGGVRRLGRAFAVALAAAGANVVVTSRSLDAESAAVVQELTDLGVRAHAVACDVRSPDAVIFQRGRTGGGVSWRPGPAD